MNTGFVTTSPESIALWRNHSCVEECEHVEAGEPIAGVGGESDSFGPVTRIMMCAKCVEEARLIQRGLFKDLAFNSESRAMDAARE